MLLTALPKTSLIGMAIATSISSFFSFTKIAEARRCRTIANDWDGTVDVRSQPNYNIFNLIATFPNGTQLDIIGERNGWLEIYASDNRLGPNYQTGWVDQKQTRRICAIDHRPRYSRYLERPQPPHQQW